VIVSKRLIIAFILGLAFTIIADFALKAMAKPRAELWGSELVGYWAAFGFIWYLIIVAFSKLLGRYWLERGEDYYNREDEVSDE
jgi:hypothetical protein